MCGIQELVRIKNGVSAKRGDFTQAQARSYKPKKISCCVGVGVKSTDLAEGETRTSNRSMSRFIIGGCKGGELRGNKQ